MKFLKQDLRMLLALGFGILLCLALIYKIWISFVLIIPITLLLSMNFKYLMIAAIFFLLLLLSFYFRQQSLLAKNIDGEFRVNNVIKFGPIVRFEDTNILIKNAGHFAVGDILNIKSNQISEIKNSDLSFASNFLQSKNIFFVATDAIVTTKKNSQTPLSLLQNFLDKGEYYKKIEPIVLLGVLEKDSDIYKSVTDMGIVHLVVISGLHVMLLQKAITVVISKFISNSKMAILISFLPLIIYALILNMPFPLVRALIFSFISFLNKYYWRKKLDSLTILSITLMTAVLVIPYQVFSLSFIFILISLSTIFCLNNLPIKNKYLKTLVITLAIFIMTMPMTIFINGKIIILSWLFSFILMGPFAAFYLINFLALPFFPIAEFICKVFYFVIYYLHFINVSIDTGKIPIIFVQLIYEIPISAFIMFKTWKYSMVRKNFLLNKK